MAETDNIARIAEKVSNEVFAVFGWERHTLHNQNWACAVGEHFPRANATHPSDVVFFYEDPYEGGHVYVTTDLKSYAKNTIVKEKVAGAMRRLAMSAECANISEQFQRLYIPDHGRWTAVGLLFIYNHDDAYSSNFDELLAAIDKKNLALATGRRMFVMGPNQIRYLYNVARDIVWLRGKGTIPAQDACHFYYPDMVRTTTLSGKEARAASLEWLAAPWQILRYRRPTPGGGGVDGMLRLLPRWRRFHR
jgi:hypothetical protein